MDEHERTIIHVCEQAVDRLTAPLDEAEIGCLFLYGDTLRHVAHSGRLPLIYEVPRDQGGVVWRAADRAEVQLVEDVRSDPDYLTSDEAVRAEIAAPVLAGGSVVAVLDVEFPGRVYDPREVEAVRSEARRLGAELAPYVS